MRAAIVIMGFGFSLLSLGALADKVLDVPQGATAKRSALRLVWVDMRGAARTVRPAAMAETATLLNAAGLDVTWQTAGGLQRAVRDEEVLVVVLPGTPSSLPRDVMGTAHPGVPGARAVWVFLSGVRQALGYSTQSGIMPPGETANVGRAIGRVIVHEIVHLTAPDRPHEATGLMAPRLGRGILIQAHIDLDPELNRVLHRAAQIGAPVEDDTTVRTVMAETGPAPARDFED
jgi:hypothetical protein